MKALVVYKKSTFEYFSQSPDAETRAYALDPTPQARELLRAHCAHYRSLDSIMQDLEDLNIPSTFVHRAVVGKDLIQSHELHIAVGGDGTVLDYSHFIHDEKLIGVNSDPHLSVGNFCMYDASSFRQAIENYDEQSVSKLARMQLTLDDERIAEPVLNDILIAHSSPAAMTRYAINGTKYRDSGLLVCTAAGSTAFVYNEGGSIMDLDDERFQYIQRSLREQENKFVDAMTITSQTREGNIWIDGDRITYPFPLGSTLRVEKGPYLNLIGDLNVKR